MIQRPLSEGAPQLEVWLLRYPVQQAVALPPNRLGVQPQLGILQSQLVWGEVLPPKPQSPRLCNGLNGATSLIWCWGIMETLKCLQHAEGWCQEDQSPGD